MQHTEIFLSGEKKQTVQPLLLTLSQVSKALGLGRTKVYELITAEGLPVVRFGRAVRVRPESLQQWLKAREEQTISA